MWVAMYVLMCMGMYVSFLVSVIIYFGLKVNVEISTLVSLWKTDLLNQQVMQLTYGWI